jgi:pyruvate dehydrogenase E2 component (dihydrolipoamide acetyltransferase)
VSGRIVISVPDLGDFHDVEVIDVLVAPGDRIELETPLITLETDKATMDVPATAAGRVVELSVSRGARVSKGDAVLVLEAEDATIAAGAAGEPSVTPPVTAAAGPPAMPVGSVELRVPDIGDFHDVEVIDVLVAEGDVIELETPLVTLETDKATMDVPATAAGRVAAVHLARGARVNAGDLVVTLVSGGRGPVPAAGGSVAAPAPSPSPAKVPPAATQSPSPAATPPATTPSQAAAAGQQAAGPTLPSSTGDSGFSRAHASPSVRRFARELGVDLGRVKGTGLKGRISHDDVKAWVKQAITAVPTAPAPAALPRVPAVDFAAFGPVDVRALTRIQKISGPRLHASWINVPHVTQHEDADITDMEALRVELKAKAADAGVKVTPLAFILRACARVLADFPRFNSSLDESGENLVFKKYLHLGFAADTPNGLVVPVIRDANRKDLYEIARDLATLSEKARAGRLSAAEMQGGCFTISSLGGIGGTAFTPIINAPEVAILGVSRSQTRPVWQAGQFVPRLILPLSLSYDHRVIDGAEAARFVVALASALAEPRCLLEAVP